MPECCRRAGSLAGLRCVKTPSGPARPHHCLAPLSLGLLAVLALGSSLPSASGKHRHNHTHTPPAPAPQGRFPAEEAALLDFSRSVSAQVGTFDTWNKTVYPNYCTWAGVLCEASGHVNTLAIVQAYLLGTIVRSLSKLEKLSRLDLHRNYLSGSIPESVAALSNLAEVKLHVNQLSGPIPSSFWRPGLKTLLLASNQISDVFPRLVTRATSLQSLRLGYNNISGPLPNDIGALRNLSYLSFPSNKVSGSIPASVASLLQLWTFDASNNSLSGPLPQLSACTLLRNLTLPNNTLSGPVPDSLSALSLLEVLDLSANQLSGPLPSALGSLASLALLDLHNNSLSGPLPPSLHALSLLRLLDVSLNGFSGGVPTEYSALSSLMQLDVSANPALGGTLPDLWSTLQSLTALNLSAAGLRGPLLSSLFLAPNLTHFSITANFLNGTLPSAALTFSNGSLKPFIGNCFESTLPPQDCPQPPANGLCFLPDQRMPAQCLPPLAESSDGVNSGVAISILIIVALVIVLVVAVGIFVAHQRRQRARGATVVQKKKKRKQFAAVIEADTYLPGMPKGLKQFSMSDVWDATCDFTSYVDPNYVAWPAFNGELEDGSHAMFRLVPLPEDDLPLSKQAFVDLVVGLTRLSSPHLLALSGYAYEEGTFVAAFEECHQTLYDRLHVLSVEQPLLWRERIRITLSVADALCFLHSSAHSSNTREPQEAAAPVVHGNVKSASVILTPLGEAKLADALIPRDPSDDPLRATSARGTFGYLDPLYADTKRLTTASDVYSFGILLLELISGRPAMQEDSGTLIVMAQDYFILRDDYPKLLDPCLHLRTPADADAAGVPRHELIGLVELVQECTQVREEGRPTMREVKEKLITLLAASLSEDEASSRVVPKGATSASSHEIEIEMMSDDDAHDDARTDGTV